MISSFSNKSRKFRQSMMLLLLLIYTVFRINLFICIHQFNACTKNDTNYSLHLSSLIVINFFLHDSKVCLLEPSRLTIIEHVTLNILLGLNIYTSATGNNITWTIPLHEQQLHSNQRNCYKNCKVATLKWILLKLHS